MGDSRKFCLDFFKYYHIFPFLPAKVGSILNPENQGKFRRKSSLFFVLQKNTSDEGVASLTSLPVRLIVTVLYGVTCFDH